MSLSIRCGNGSCSGKAMITMIRNTTGVGPITVWVYHDFFGRLMLDQTVLDAGPLQGKCPRCLEDEEKKREQ